MQLFSVFRKHIFRTSIIPHLALLTETKTMEAKNVGAVGLFNVTCCICQCGIHKRGKGSFRRIRVSLLLKGSYSPFRDVSTILA